MFAPSTAAALALASPLADAADALVDTHDTNYVLAAAVGPRRRCATGAQRDGALSLRSLLAPPFVLGAASDSAAAACEEEEDDDWARLTRPKARAAPSALPAEPASPTPPLACRDWWAIENGTLAASDGDQLVVRLWRHLQRHRRLPRERLSKRALVSVSAVVTLSSPLVEATLRPGVVLYHSAAKGGAASPTHARRACDPAHPLTVRH
eukprot:4397342-Prymnesium_polylepis.1